MISRQHLWIFGFQPLTKPSTVTPATTSFTSVLLREARKRKNAKNTPDTTGRYVPETGLTSGTKRGRMETTLVVTKGKHTAVFPTLVSLMALDTPFRNLNCDFSLFHFLI